MPRPSTRRLLRLIREKIRMGAKKSPCTAVPEAIIEEIVALDAESAVVLARIRALI